MDFLPVTASSPATSAQGLLLDRWLQQLRSSARSSSERRQQQQQQHQGGSFSLFEIPTQLLAVIIGGCNSEGKATAVYPSDILSVESRRRPGQPETTGVNDSRDGIACPVVDPTMRGRDGIACPVIDPTMRGLTCITCGLSFDAAADQYSHFKTDLHLINLRRKLKGLSPLLTAAAPNDDEPSSNGGVADPVSALDVDDDDSGSDSDRDSTSGEEHELPDKLRNGEEDQQKDINLQQCSSPRGDIIVSKQTVPHLGAGLVVRSSQCCEWVFSFSFSLFSMHPSLAAKVWNNTTVDGGGGDGDTAWSVFSRQVLYLRFHPRIGVFLLRSGRFAAALFDGPSMIVHKVFRRYTVRAKSGGGQSSHDNKGGKARSAGAMLRRYGEQALKDDIASLLQLWSGHIQCCSVLLIAAPRTLQHCLFDVSMSKGGGTVLSKDDPRISSVPFAVSRPTLDEVRTVHERCTHVHYSRALHDDGMETVTRSAAAATVESICIPSIQESCEMTAGDKEQSNHPNNHDSEAGSPVPEFVMHPAARELIQACLAGNESLVISLVAALERDSVPSSDTSTAQSDDPLDIESDLDPNSTGSYSNSNSRYHQQIMDAVDSLEQMRTPLHICSEAGMHSAVFSLLLVGGASPLRVDVRGRTPYFVAKNKETRDAFRRYRGVVGEDRYDWNSTGVGAALSEETEKSQKAREREKKKRAAQRKREQKLSDEAAAAEAVRRLQSEAQVAASAASEAMERRRIEAGRCAMCEESLYGRLALDVFDRRCCSSGCVVQLRRKLQAEAAMKRIAASSSLSSQQYNKA